MGRSVSTPSGCIDVCYTTFEPEDEFDSEFEWDNFIYSLREKAMTQWPSLTECDEWIRSYAHSSEDHAILENNHCYIGVSEYCGCVSIWLLSKADELECYPNEQNIALGWCRRIAGNFNKLFSDLTKIGTMSNGVSVYERAQP